MTLVEVMAAMAVFALIGSGLYGGLVQVMNMKRRVEAELDRYHEIRLGMERVVRELSMAYVSIHVNPDPALAKVRTAFVGTEAGGGSRIDFTSFSHRRLYRNAHESDQNELSYFVTSHPEGGRDVLARREQRRVDDDPQQGGQTQILIDDVVEFGLRYLDPMTGEWLSTWDAAPEGTEPNRLPSQVEIKLTVPNIRGNGPDQTFGTRVSIPIQWALNHAVYKS
jgi:general secretion pathway protein J